MEFTYDDEADAAYFYILDRDAMILQKVAQTITCEEASEGGMINLDLDQEGRLIGIEVLNAKAKLPLKLFE